MIGRHPIIGPRTRSLILRGSTCSPDCPKQAIAECPRFLREGRPADGKACDQPDRQPQCPEICLHPPPSLAAHGSRRLSAASSSVCKGYLSSQTSSIAIAVVNAVDHGHEPFDIKLRAGRPTRTSAHLAHICRHWSLGKSVTCSRQKGEASQPLAGSFKSL